MDDRGSRLAGVAVVFALVVAGCRGPSTASDAGAGAARQTAFRVRADFDAALNADAGWAAGLNENAIVATEQPFRLRFELEHGGDAELGLPFGLEYRRNGGDWTSVPAADFPYAEIEELTPRVGIVSTRAYANGAATTDLLPRSPAPFAGGMGIALASRTPAAQTTDAPTPAAPAAGGHSEWEWPLVIRRYADGAVTNETGDRFELRMVDASGAAAAATAYPTLTVDVPARLLGGTFVETPGRIGPWQAANGDLYFIMEPAESDNVLMVVKSSDGGLSWSEVDGANRPATDDLEGFASAASGDTIHMLHQVSERVVYHTFRTSDHAAQPDTWAIRDEPVAAPAGEPPVQFASIVVRSDASVVGVYAGPEKIHLRIRTPSGEWGGETVVDADVPPNLSGPQAVLGSGDVVHLAYTGSDGTAWYRRILPDGTLTPREPMAAGLGMAESDVGSILPLVFVAETDTLVLIYRVPSGELWERRVIANGAPTAPVRVTDRSVVQNAVDSDQTGADAIAHGTDVHVLFIESGSGRILHTVRRDEGTWAPAALAVDNVRAQWVRGAAIELGGRARYGYVYDAGSNGGSGLNWFGDLPLDGL